MNWKDIKWSTPPSGEPSLAVFLLLIGLILSPILFSFLCPCVNPTPIDTTVVFIVLEGIAVGTSLRLARYKDRALCIIGILALCAHLLIVMMIIIGNLKYLLK